MSDNNAVDVPSLELKAQQHILAAIMESLIEQKAPPEISAYVIMDKVIPQLHNILDLVYSVVKAYKEDNATQKDANEKSQASESNSSSQT